MVDLLPAGIISHGVYGNPKWVQNQANDTTNSWGVQKPGRILKFGYESASVGAGFISCEGQRVCGATMTSDGLGRWAVPSAKDIPEVLNMLTASIQKNTEYLEQTCNKIYDAFAEL